MLIMPDFNRLKVFFHVHQLQSIQRAAESLNVTRSAISQHLAHLEDELKTSLFIRTNRTLLPTTQGEALFRAMEPFMQALHETLGSLERGRQGPFGLLRIGAPAELGSNYLVPIISSFRKHFPLVKFQLTLAIPPTLCELVCNNQVDFALIDAGDVFERLYPISVKPVLNEAQILACSQKYYDQYVKEDHSYRNLIKLPYVSHVIQSTELKFWFKYHLNKMPPKLDLAMISEDIIAIKNAVKGGIGLGLLPVRLIKDELSDGRILKIPTAKKDYSNKIMLAQLPDRTSTLTEKTFIKHCLDGLGSAF